MKRTNFRRFAKIFSIKLHDIDCISRIKTNTTGAEFLYLPLEVEVSSQPGLYCPQVKFQVEIFSLLALSNVTSWFYLCFHSLCSCKLAQGLHPPTSSHILSTNLSQEMLNFGLVPSDSGPRTMELLILNSGTRPVTLNSLVATPVTDALAVEFSSIKVIIVITGSSVTELVGILSYHL